MKYALFFLLMSTAYADWPQGSGPHLDYIVEGAGPQAFSASVNRGIKWRIKLPEFGQSSPVIVGGKIFLTCFKPAIQDTKTGTDLIGMCFDRNNGALLWQKQLPGDHASKISGCFGDNSSPAPVSDGKSVCFFNAAGLINKYDLQGKLLWSSNIRHSTRCDPYLLGDTLIINGSAESHTVVGRHLRGIDWATGKQLWESSNFSWESSTSFAYKRSDGSWVALIGRGGSHAKGKFTEGISLINLKDGKELWTHPIKHFKSTQNLTIRNDKAYVFLSKGVHLVLDLADGKLIRQDDLLKNAMGDIRTSQGYVYGPFDKPLNFSKMTIIQMSNLLVGNYHYFRTYTGNYLARVHIETGKTEYLNLPAQLVRTKEATVMGWGKRATKNKMISNSGFRVCGDERSLRAGWGHHVSAMPIVVGNTMYVPTMCGLVYVIKWNADKLEIDALVSISDLGELGDSWNRSALSFSDGLLYARTIKELLCISGCAPEALPKDFGKNTRVK
jgi:outer membrane protein assembly factor BamB